MSKTTNLDLELTGTSSEDTSQSFLTWRQKINGESSDSNMNKIDAAFGDLKSAVGELTDQLKSKIGSTPFINTVDDRKGVYLSSDNETDYVGYMPTAYETADADYSPSGATKDPLSDYPKFDCTAGKSWYQSKVTITLRNLIVGKTYKAILDLSNITKPSGTSPWMRLYTTTDLSDSPKYIYPQDNIASKTFTASATTHQVLLTASVTTQSGDYLAFNECYCNISTASDDKTDVQNISGTFTGFVNLPTLNNGITIESTPTCDLYEQRKLSQVYTVDGVGPDSSGNIDLPKTLNGKKVVNFGDSIFGMHRPPNDISTKIATLTGATVYNCGFGGCRMSQQTYANRSTWGQFSMFELADAIVSNDWTGQDAAVAQSGWGMPSYFPEALALLKSIDFSEVDIVTIAYGTNDFTAGVPLDDPEDLDAIDTFAGALRYSLEKLLTAYPQLRIFICGQTYRFWMDENNNFLYDSNTHKVNDVLLTDFVEKSNDVAKEYNLPFIDNYNIGIGKYTRSVYFPADDGTHQNLNGVKLIAAHIAKEISW